MYNVISPDGFTISRDKKYRTIKESVIALSNWIEGFRTQGYYSSNNGRIPFDEIVYHCDIVKTSIPTIDKIITKVDTKYGAPMGRPNVGKKPRNKTIFDCKVPMIDGCYDKGGAYFGIGKELRVSYTKDLKYIRFYRVGDKI